MTQHVKNMFKNNKKKFWFVVQHSWIQSEYRLKMNTSFLRWLTFHLFFLAWMSFHQKKSKMREEQRMEEVSEWMKVEDEEVKVLLYHDFSRLFLFQYEAQGVGVGSRHEAEKQRLLAIPQLTHKYCGSHTHNIIFLSPFILNHNLN